MHVRARYVRCCMAGRIQLSWASVNDEKMGSLRRASGLPFEAFIRGGLVSVSDIRGGPGKIVVRNAPVFCKKVFQTVPYRRFCFSAMDKGRSRGPLAPLRRRATD